MTRKSSRVVVSRSCCKKSVGLKPQPCDKAGMRKQFWVFSAKVVLLGTALTAQAANEVAPVELRCEYLSDPLGIDDVHPRLSWALGTEGREPSVARGVTQSAYRILVASSPEKLASDKGDYWDTGKVLSGQSVQIEYGGQLLVTGQGCYWKVQVWDGSGGASSWSAPAQWTMGLLKPEDWHARWIKADTTKGGLPLFRTMFRVGKPVRRAELAICGLGFYGARLNGKSLDDDAVLEPGWTNYRKTCLYRVHDLAQRLVQGENVIGVMLGNGMYDVVGGRYTKFTGSFGPPKLIAQLEIEYADGSMARVATDRSWKTAPGPIVFSCIYGGEDYDARKENAGWDRPGFDASAWHPAQECDGPGGRLSSRSGPPIKVKESLQPIKVTQPRPGLWLYDLGQNFSGWPKLSVNGAAGATVKMVTGELLAHDGLVSQRSSGAPVWFAYTLKGQGTETWEPRFSYSGFRYVQVEGAVPASETNAAPGMPRIQNLEGKFLYPDTAVAGAFSCSNPEVIRLIFAQSGSTRLFSSSIVEALRALSDRPWSEPPALNGQSIKLTEARLARELLALKVRSRRIRIAGKQARGYDLADFAQLFTRFLDRQSPDCTWSPEI